jgi:hypothetical protein
MPVTTAEPDSPYDPDAIFDPDGPLHPGFMDEAIRTLMRNLPLDDPTEPRHWSYRRMHSALRALAALHPRDEIEIMLGVQALSAYHAAAACWRIGMNLRRPHGDSTRHLSAAASAARTFDSLLRALERRQAKPLFIPIGRPAPRQWPESDSADIMLGWENRCRDSDPAPDLDSEPSDQPTPPVEWTPEALAIAEAMTDQARVEQENEGLDIANTEGILPGGGMIMPEHPTPQQAAYIARRLALMYKREIAENRRNGITKYPKIRPLRTGDRVP